MKTISKQALEYKSLGQRELGYRGIHRPSIESSPTHLMVIILFTSLGMNC